MSGGMARRTRIALETMAKLKTLTVRGFKSIKELSDFQFTNLNVLIGPNGAGKSNFIALFRMLAEIDEKRLQLFVQEHDGPDGLLFGGRKKTEQIEAEFYFDRNGYRLSLVPKGDKLLFAREQTFFRGDFRPENVRSYGSGHAESNLPDAEGDSFAQYVRPALSSWRVFHFHDTSRTAAVRLMQPVRDNLRLKPDAGNLAPFLRMLKEKFPLQHKRIVETVRMAAPFFGDFVYRDDVGERMELEWFESDDSDTPRSPRQLSDGTLRFTCLATLLLQPDHLKPSTILLDEPELGLHPYALVLSLIHI